MNQISKGSHLDLYWQKFRDKNIETLTMTKAFQREAGNEMEVTKTLFTYMEGEEREKESLQALLPEGWKVNSVRGDFVWVKYEFEPEEGGEYYWVEIILVIGGYLQFHGFWEYGEGRCKGCGSKNRLSDDGYCNDCIYG